jgi:hypothetical protein
VRAVDWINRDGVFMSRNVLHTTEKIEVYQRVEERNCDKCGNPIHRQEYTDPATVAHELLIYLDAEECVNARFRRDYCDLCLEHIWVGICELIDADPDDYSGSDFDEDD